jgi:hypothetical protein
MNGRLCDLEDNLGERIPFYLELESISNSERDYIQNEVIEGIKYCDYDYDCDNDDDYEKSYNYYVEKIRTICNNAIVKGCNKTIINELRYKWINE